MLILLSLLLAYGLAGLSQVSDDLGADLISKPAWARRPTLGMLLLVMATWPIRPIQNAGYSDNAPRSIAFALLGVLVTVLATAGLIWGCLRLTVFLTPNLYLEVALSFGFVVSLRLLAPILNLVLMPVTLLLAAPLDFLFPLKVRVRKEDKEEEGVVICIDCQHFKTGMKFAVRGGPWQSKTMPSIDQLPCKIASETVQTWTDFFSTDPQSRFQYPINCPRFQGDSPTKT